MQTKPNIIIYDGDRFGMQEVCPMIWSRFILLHKSCVCKRFTMLSGAKGKENNQIGHDNVPPESWQDMHVCLWETGLLANIKREKNDSVNGLLELYSRLGGNQGRP